MNEFDNMIDEKDDEDIVDYTLTITYDAGEVETYYLYYDTYEKAMKQMKKIEDVVNNNTTKLILVESNESTSYYANSVLLRIDKIISVSVSVNEDDEDEDEDDDEY